MRAAMRAMVGLVVVSILAAGAVLWSRGHYHQWPWSSYPNPLSWCGRDWIPTGVETRGQILSKNDKFHRAGDLPGWLNRGSVWTGLAHGGVGGTSCAISEVWVRLGADRFEAMNLSGGF